MDLHIKYKYQQEEKVTILRYERERLESASYFVGLFEVANVEDYIVVDLAFMENIEPMYVDIVFAIEFSSDLGSLLTSDKTVSKIDIHVNRKHSKEYKCELVQNMGLKDVNMADLYYIARISDYLDFPKTRDVVKKCLGNYCEMFNRDTFDKVSRLFWTDINTSEEDNVESNKVDYFKYPQYFLQKLIPRNVVEICTIYIKSSRNIGCNVPEHYIIQRSLYKVQLMTFYRYAYQIFLTCKLVDMLEQFNSVVKNIKFLLEHWQTHENMFNMNNNRHVFTIRDLNSECFNSVVEFVYYYDPIFIFDNQEMVNVYDYYDWIVCVEDYKWPNCVVDNLLISEHSIMVPYDVGSEKFKSVTKGIFDDFVWDGVYVCGLFVYKLLHEVPGEWPEMDLVCVDNKTMEYVHEYFSRVSPYYANGRILIKELPFDICVYVEDRYINNFFSFEQLRYDGTLFRASFFGLLLLKYNMCKLNMPSFEVLYDYVNLGISVWFDWVGVYKYSSIVSDNIKGICFKKLKDVIDLGSKKRAHNVRELWNSNIGKDVFDCMMKLLYK